MSYYQIIVCILASISYIILLEVIALDLGVLDNIFIPKRFAASTDVAIQLPDRNVTLWSRQAVFGKHFTNASATTVINLYLPSNFQEDMSGCPNRNDTDASYFYENDIIDYDIEYIEQKSYSSKPSARVQKDDGGESKDEAILDFLLVQRGKCTYFDKALEAQRLGFKGVIVGDNRSPSSFRLHYMVAPDKVDESKVHIPSLFVSTSSYNLLWSDLLHSYRQPLKLYAKPEELGDMFWPFLLCFSPSIIMLITVQALAIRKFIRTYRTKSKTRRFIEDLPSRTISREGFYSEEEEIENSTQNGELVPLMDESTRRATFGVECVICLESFTKGDKVVALPCKHEFHRPCIAKWIVDYRHACPTCNTEVPPPKPF
ncbi:RNF family protein [Schizosaccharomyces pombe]|uniref:Uncharacterized RING finger protein C57A7.09 n=1 Tax=Schizosaccharomyces pombe (strain 972 / ATCC 24843) TaxID=284812 RepID=YDM9_SCHPO|nr:RING finger protein [Schizosaccharomyces pombe]P87139.1 RecName: Full=Uncharacterized RING finger protein C57A7.09; Flags: Precursor [Schizosaccharomyces pombe 972h-]CAB08767.1 human RNF family homolog [Schizosaccharomyces pombe]|eukprot:NP_593372.1 RING finger protein [Schizosaccharomyces pombe]